MSKIILADDDEDFRTLAIRKLKKQGIEVIEAKDGKEAFELCLKHRPDVIIMDLEMPEMDGYLSAAKLKIQEGLESLKIIGVSARPDTYDHELDYYVQKPVDFPKLITILKAFSPVKSE